MTRICPKCSYARKETDEAPEWQCPSCQVAYNKVGGEPVPANYGRYGAPIIREKPPGFPVFKLVAVIAVFGAGILIGKPLWQAKSAPPQATAATAQPPVTMYSAEWCGYCTAAREFMDANGIAYTEFDIEKTTAGYEGHKKLGGGVPLLVIGDDVIRGYSEPTMRSNLRPWLKGS